MSTKKEELFAPAILQELEDAKEWGKDKSDNELVEAFVNVFRNADIVWIDKVLADCINTLRTEESLDKNTLSMIEACKFKFINLHATTIEEIAEALQQVTYAIPRNIYNIREALESFARNLNPFYPQTIKQACSCVVADIASNDQAASGTLYTHEDIEEAHQKGYEAGYSKCLSNKQNEDMGDRWADIEV